MSSLLWLLWACGGPAVDEVPSAPSDGEPVVEPSTGSPTVPQVLHPELLGDARADTLGTVQPPEARPEGRVRRRMDIDQLNASLRAVTGGIGWDDGDDDQLEELSSTLGRPDYAESTHEDLSPGLLFAKFLDDAANHVCDALVERESVGAADNVFLVHVDLTDTSASAPQAVEDNLQHALLRFHGHDLPDGDPRLEPWRFLFDTTVEVTGGDTFAGWRSVCIALLVHPDFTLY
jgi:hypothetical protein